MFLLLLVGINLVSMQQSYACVVRSKESQRSTQADVQQQPVSQACASLILRAETTANSLLKVSTVHGLLKMRVYEEDNYLRQHYKSLGC